MAASGFAARWKEVLYFVVLACISLSVPAYIAAKEWGSRACADPNAWQQKSFGQASAECKARGGKPYSDDIDGTIECTRSERIEP